MITITSVKGGGLANYLATRVEIDDIPQNNNSGFTDYLNKNITDKYNFTVDYSFDGEAITSDKFKSFLIEPEHKGNKPQSNPKFVKEYFIKDGDVEYKLTGEEVRILRKDGKLTKAITATEAKTFTKKELLSKDKLDDNQERIEQEKTTGFDIIQSYSKSLALYLSVIPENKRLSIMEDIKAIHARNIKSIVMDNLTARTGSAGSGGSVPVKAMLMTSMQLDSRNPTDPLLAEDFFISNYGVDAQGNVRAIDATKLYTLHRELDKVNQCEVAKLLIDKYELNLYFKTEDSTKLDDNSKEMIQHFEVNLGKDSENLIRKYSKGSDEIRRFIKEEIKSLEVDYESKYESLKLQEQEGEISHQEHIKLYNQLDQEKTKQLKFLGSREHNKAVHKITKGGKGKDDYDTLIKKWENSLSNHMADIFETAHKIQDTQKPKQLSDDEILKLVTDKQEIFRKQDLVATIASQGMGILSREEIYDRAQKIESTLLKSTIIDSRRNETTIYTTNEMKIQSFKLKQVVKELASKKRVIFSEEERQAIYKDMEEKKIILTDDQQNVIEGMLSDKNIVMVQGSAGSGKSFDMALFNNYMKQYHPEIRIQAITTKHSVKDDLIKDGLSTKTIASFLSKKENAESIRDGVLLIDEAGEIGLRTYNHILATCKEHNIKLVAVGDVFQNAAISAGANTFGKIQSYADDSGSQTIFLSETNRQGKGTDEQVITDKAQGLDFKKELEKTLIDGGLSKENAQKEVKEKYYQYMQSGEAFHKHFDEMMEKDRVFMADANILDKIMDKYFSIDDKSKAIIASKKDDVVALNDMIKKKRQELGEVAEESITIHNKDYDIDLSKGDKIVFNATFKQGKTTITNNTKAEVVNIKHSKSNYLIDIRIDGAKGDDIKQIKISRDDPQAPILLGYAMTVNVSQGKTFNHTINYLAPSQIANIGNYLVSATRHKMDSTIFLERKALSKVKELYARSNIKESFFDYNWQQPDGSIAEEPKEALQAAETKEVTPTPHPQSESHVQLPDSRESDIEIQLQKFKHHYIATQQLREEDKGDENLSVPDNYRKIFQVIREDRNIPKEYKDTFRNDLIAGNIKEKPSNIPILVYKFLSNGIKKIAEIKVSANNRYLAWVKNQNNSIGIPSEQAINEYKSQIKAQEVIPSSQKAQLIKDFSYNEYLDLWSAIKGNESITAEQEIQFIHDIKEGRVSLNDDMVNYSFKYNESDNIRTMRIKPNNIYVDMISKLTPNIQKAEILNDKTPDAIQEPTIQTKPKTSEERLLESLKKKQNKPTPFQQSI